MRGFGAIIKMLECIPASLPWVHCFFAAGAKEKPLLFNVLYMGEKRGCKKPQKIFQKSVDKLHIRGYNDEAVRCGPLVKRSRRRPLTPQTGVRFSHGSPRRNGLHSIQKAQPFGWAFLIPFRHSSLTPQNFARQTFAGAPLPGENERPGRMDCILFKELSYFAGLFLVYPAKQSRTNKTRSLTGLFV